MHKTNLQRKTNRFRELRRRCVEILPLPPSTNLALTTPISRNMKPNSLVSGSRKNTVREKTSTESRRLTPPPEVAAPTPQVADLRQIVFLLVVVACEDRTSLAAKTS